MIETTKRYLRVAAGWCLVVVGVVLIPLPGPGLLSILGGLTVLSRESAWARRLMGRLKRFVRSIRARAAK